MRGPPDPEMRNRPAGNGTADRRAVMKKPDQTTEAAAARQFQSPLKLQAFCLARRFALSAPLAEALAPLIWGLRT
jgi:hypothetical protein